MNKKSFAFTLSEVLITMSIVGVVAALTIPTLFYQKVKKEYTAKLKNFYSHMENAILDMEAEKGSFRDMKQPATYIAGYDWYMENIDPYYGHQYVVRVGNTPNNKVYYKDGSMLTQFYPGGCMDVDYDVNGDKGPNQQGYDRFRFLYCFTDNNRRSWFGNQDIFFGTYGSGLTSAGVKRQTMINNCAAAATRSWCTRLLQNDQWEFKEDYPLRF